MILFVMMFFSLSAFANFYQLSEDLKDEPGALFSLKLKKGISHNLKFGASLDLVNDGAAHPIWQGNGSYPWPTSALALSVVSTDADDAAGDTGARTVEICGLGADYLDLHETITLNGTTPVNSTGLFLRVNRMRVITSGTSGRAEGTITLKSGANAIAIILPKYNQTLQAIFTVPANKYVVVDSIHSSVYKLAGAASAVKEAEITFSIRNIGSVFQTKWSSGGRSDGGQVGWVLHSPLVYGPKTDIIAEGSTTLTDTAVSFQYSMLLIDKDELETALSSLGYTLADIADSHFF